MMSEFMEDDLGLSEARVLMFWVVVKVSRVIKGRAREEIALVAVAGRVH